VRALRLTRPGWRSRVAVAAVVLVVASGHAIRDAPPAAAAVALVQKGTEAFGAGTSITATFSSATTAGHLLVATTQDLNSGCASDNYTAPAGWVVATTVCRGSNGPLKLWYYPNAPAGITSVVFNTGSSGANSVAQLSEWSGIATSSPLDQTGTFSSGGSSTTLTVTTSGNIAATGELAITAFDASAGLSSFTPGGGWTSLRSDPGNGYDSDYEIGPPAGSTLSESVTSNPQTSWGAVIATFKTGCAGGSLTIESSPTLSFPSVGLNAYDRTTTVNVAVTTDDETGTSNSWNLTATSTTFDAGSGRTLPTTATRITAGSAVAHAGNCSTPTNSIGYPITLPAGSSPPTAVTIFDAAANTGKGPSDVTLTAVVSVPGRARAGTYSSTWTLTIASGP